MVGKCVSALALAFALASCGSEGAPSVQDALPDGVQVLSEGSIAPGRDPGKPGGEVVLTVDGLRGADGVSFDIAMLDRARTVEVSVYEPFVKERTTFSGVLVTDLLAIAGVEPDATVRMVALDDYVATFTARDLRAGGAVLATREEGRHIPVDRGGPIRVVFPDASVLAPDTALWIWSVRTMTVT